MIQGLFWYAASKLPSVANATTTQGPGPGPQGPGPQCPPGKVCQITFFDPLKDKFTSVPDFLNYILQNLTLLAIPIVTIMIIVGAYYLITSGGNPGRRTKGKDYILWAAIGFAVLLLADSVTAIISDFLSP